MPTSIAVLDATGTTQTVATNDALATLLTALLAKDFSTQATLSALLTKILAAPATEAKQDTGNTSLASIDGKLTVVSTRQSASISTTAATLTQGAKAVAAAGTPERLVATSTLVESVELHARKSPTVANTGNIYVGISATAGQNLRALIPGESFTIVAPPGKMIDTRNIFLDAATSADAVTWTAVT